MQIWKIRLNWVGVCGIVLSLLSLPWITLTTMEQIYNLSMNNRYKIESDYGSQLTEDPFEDPYNPGTPPFTYGKNKVELRIKPKKEIKKPIFAGDVEVYLNEKLLDTLKNRVLESVYTSSEDEPTQFTPLSAKDVSVFALTDSETNQSQVIILAEISDYEVRDENYLNNKYYRDGMEEMLKFRLWKVRADGTFTKEEFGYKGKRTYLQTYLVQNTGYPIGQYTDVLFAWPTYFFPLFYPYVTGFIGLILILFGIERKSWLG